jgi:ubiquinone/menaquinone biosynthesis C-methylase UbiE
VLRSENEKYKKLLLEVFMNQNYWDKVYTDKSEKEVSWFQEHPTKSLSLIHELNLSKDASIIDVGGGESRLVDNLLEEGHSNISVLDISKVSLNKLKQRLGDVENKIKYIISDVLDFRPETQFDLWHDRATFHFLTNIEQIDQYLKIVNNSLPSGGNLIISTFSKNGPEKCSGLPVHQYSESELKNLFGKYFNNTKCFEHTHVTPWGSTQSFIYCGFKKK